MTAKVFSVAHIGLRSHLVEVEADISKHLPSFVLVGLPDTAIQEARERIRSAIENSNLEFPRTKVTVNLAPAHIRKEGSTYDLAIAISILCAHQTVKLAAEDSQAVFLGELALNGMLRPVKGVLLALSYLKEKGIREVYIPVGNAREASYIHGVTIYPVSSLAQLIEHVTQVRRIDPLKHVAIPRGELAQSIYDFADVRGQQQAKRALEIAAAGGHNVLLSGVPGSGKTMLAKSFMSILPPLSEQSIFEISKIYSYAGLLPEDTGVMTTRPFRAPHHTASVASIVGGGTWPRPGEVTLAHHGVLFLDEFPEFPRSVLESLRQPLEDRVISVSRAAGSLQFPARFLLLAAQNPCPCGYWGHPEKQCICTEFQLERYRHRVSGPLLDRIDLHIRVFPVLHDHLIADTVAESSAKIRERVAAAQTRQRERFLAAHSPAMNAELNSQAIKRWCALNKKTKETLLAASRRLSLSARAFYKTIKVARTIADLERAESISEQHILEALQYRHT